MQDAQVPEPLVQLATCLFPGSPEASGFARLMPHRSKFMDTLFRSSALSSVVAAYLPRHTTETDFMRVIKHDGAIRKDALTVSKIVQLTARLPYVTFEHLTPVFQHASRRGDLLTIKWLIDFARATGATHEPKWSLTCITKLHEALQWDEWKLATVFCDALCFPEVQMDPAVSHIYKDTLKYAIQYKSEEAALHILRNDILVHMNQPDFRFVAIEASRRNMVALCRKLVIHASYASRWRTFYTCLQYSNAETLQVWERPEDWSDEQWEKLFYRSAYLGYMHGINYFLQHPTRPQTNLVKACAAAIEAGHVDVVHRLLEAGVDQYSIYRGKSLQDLMFFANSRYLEQLRKTQTRLEKHQNAKRIRME